MSPATRLPTGARRRTRTHRPGSRSPRGLPWKTPGPAREHGIPIGPDRPAVRLLRRTADIWFSSAALLLLTPVFLVIAVAIKTTSHGPVLHRQTRVGLNRRREPRRVSTEPSGGPDRRRRTRRNLRNHGQPFRIVKFRTMIVNAEEDGPQWSSDDDDRITPVGRILRVTRLDETPQFWNVLRGDMSLIGPRPERPYFVNRLAREIPNYADRLRARPGMTGLAQVSLGYDSSVEDVRRKLEADIDYLRHRTLRRDLGILLRTVGVIFTGSGAR